MMRSPQYHFDFPWKIPLKQGDLMEQRIHRRNAKVREDALTPTPSMPAPSPNARPERYLQFML
jgi:hypothetical protein